MSDNLTTNMANCFCFFHGYFLYSTAIASLDLHKEDGLVSLTLDSN